MFLSESSNLTLASVVICRPQSMFSVSDYIPGIAGLGAYGGGLSGYGGGLSGYGGGLGGYGGGELVTELETLVKLDLGLNFGGNDGD